MCKIIGRCIFVLSLSCCIQYCTSQFTAVTRRQPRTHCENPSNNSLVENFFNIMFSEFYSTPPVCVCVQMCAGQSTYCYPNGCLKPVTASHDNNRDISKSVQPTPAQLQKNKNQFMLVNDEKFDFMADFLKNNYVEDGKIVPQNIKIPVPEIRPDPFKDKYSMLGKYKRVPKINLKYTISDKVKNLKSDLAKMEGVDLTKTRWPLNRSNRASAQKLPAGVEMPVISNSNFFKAMLPDNEVAEYPPKYFKRDLTKAKDANIKTFYILGNSFNDTENKSFSLETLIDTLIRSSFDTEIEIPTNFEGARRNGTEVEIKEVIETVANVSSSLTNETTSIISMNFTKENVDKNKYADDNHRVNKTGNLNEMITYLAKQIEIQNNTSMELAKTVVRDLNETLVVDNGKIIKNASNLESTTHEQQPTDDNLVPTVENFAEIELTTLDIETITKPADSITPEADVTIASVMITTSPEIKATKKNRQRHVRKLTSKIN